MAIPSGTRLGPYEVHDLLGVGGMGEVYRGRDTRLDRTVAIKILPPHLDDSERHQRFEREARVVSSLNHPHICALYDIGRQDDVDFLVMEYVEGQTLGTRLLSGPLPHDIFLQYALQIAQALAHAHRRGVLHRDLKPANVMVSREGVKLLDFGLAKFFQRAQVFDVTATIAPPQSHEMTKEGAILGTLQYMAPEQLEGKPVDERTDIFSFGTVLYEMATAKKAFTGESAASVIAAILTNNPAPLTSYGKMPAGLDRVVRKCLAKDPDSRWQTAQDLAANLEWALDNASDLPESQAVRLPEAKRLTWLVPLLVSITAALLFALIAFRRDSGRPLRVTRFSIQAPEKTVLSPAAPAVSPDGSMVAFIASADGKSMVWIRPVDSLAARALGGTDSASSMFWSPDSRSLAFAAQGKLKRIELANGSITTVADAQPNAAGDWNSDGLIIFTGSGNGALQRIPAAGGISSALTVLNLSRGDYNHSWPQWLPDRRSFLYFVRTGLGDSTGIYAGTLENASASKMIVKSYAAGRYQPLRGGGKGHLLFLKGDALMAGAFDPSSLDLTGEPVQIAEQVGGLMVDYLGNPGFSISSNGVLAYHSITGPRAQLLWLTRSGTREGIVADSDIWTHASLSRDGARAAFDRPDPKTLRSDIWFADRKRGITSRFTYDAMGSGVPVWSPGGERIVYNSARGGTRDLYWKPSDGGQEELLLKSGESKVPSDWSPDGKFILYYRGDERDSSWDIWALPLSGDRKPFPIVQSSFQETHAQFSPDGNWIVYVSNETGTKEIYARPFRPDDPSAQLNSPRIQITNGGGSHPRWRRDGRELFFLNRERRIVALPVLPGSKLQTGTPQVLFQPRGARPFEDILYDYDVTPDGQHFLFNLAIEASVSPITVVVNWDAGLK